MLFILIWPLLFLLPHSLPSLKYTRALLTEIGWYNTVAMLHQPIPVLLKLVGISTPLDIPKQWKRALFTEHSATIHLSYKPASNSYLLSTFIPVKGKTKRGLVIC